MAVFGQLTARVFCLWRGGVNVKGGAVDGGDVAGFVGQREDGGVVVCGVGCTGLGWFEGVVLGDGEFPGAVGFVEFEQLQDRLACGVGAGVGAVGHAVDGDGDGVGQGVGGGWTPFAAQGGGGVVGDADKWAVGAGAGADAACGHALHRCAGVEGEWLQGEAARAEAAVCAGHLGGHGFGAVCAELGFGDGHLGHAGQDVGTGQGVGHCRGGAISVGDSEGNHVAGDGGCRQGHGVVDAVGCFVFVDVAYAVRRLHEFAAVCACGVVDGFEGISHDGGCGGFELAGQGGATEHGARRGACAVCGKQGGFVGCAGGATGVGAKFKGFGAGIKLVSDGFDVCGAIEGRHKVVDGGGHGLVGRGGVGGGIAVDAVQTREHGQHLAVFFGVVDAVGFVVAAVAVGVFNDGFGHGAHNVFEAHFVGHGFVGVVNGGGGEGFVRGGLALG